MNNFGLNHQIPKISIILICLNDEKCIEEMLLSIKEYKYHQLIIVDGGSVDNTLEIAKKYTQDVFVSEKGMAKQTLYGINEATGDLILLVEADHVYPKNFVESLAQEFFSSEYDGIQGSLVYHNPKNFWEYGHREFFKIHFHQKGYKKLIACPQLWYKKKLSLLIESTKYAEGFSFDTQRAEVARKQNLNTGLGSTFAYEKQDINFNKFINRHLNYGKGDYDFYVHNSPYWGLLRKLKSITHIFIRYGISYPLKSIYLGNPFIALPYFWIIMLVRYFSWIKTIILKMNKYLLL